MNYLQRGFSTVLARSKEQKRLVLVLIVVQVFFLALLLYTAITYQVKIFTNVRDIIEPLQNANYDAQSIQQGKPFTTEILGVYKNYRTLITNLIQAVLWIGVLFLILNGGIWILSHYIINKERSWRNGGKQWLKYAASTIIIYGPGFIGGYYLLKIIVSTEVAVDSFSFITKTIVYVLLGVYYFLLVAFALLPVPSWKLFFKLFFQCAIKKIHYTFLILLFNASLLALSIYGIYYVINTSQSFSLLLITSILFLIVLVFTRLWWIACIQELLHEKSNY